MENASEVPRDGVREGDLTGAHRAVAGEEDDTCGRKWGKNQIPVILRSINEIDLGEILLRYIGIG